MKKNGSLAVKKAKILKLGTKNHPVDHDKKQATELQIHCILITVFFLFGKDTMATKTLVKKRV